MATIQTQQDRLRILSLGIFLCAVVPCHAQFTTTDSVAQGFTNLSAATDTTPDVAAEENYPQLPLTKRKSVPTVLPRRGSVPSNVANLNQSTIRVISALAVVVGIFLIFVWFMKRIHGKTSPSVSGESLELLGQTRINKIHCLHLIRLGQRVLLVSISDQSVTCLSEIHDPVEVAELLHSNGPAAAAPDRTFKRIFSQYEQDPNELFSA
ncbi:MAG: flagellar biosynthetic protein FliO [Planctomycetota bacterium]|nr:flagellar biosynthetic protein FliO [Planctomycetota bacterium]